MHKDFKFEVAKHIPDLWKYSKILCEHEEDANALLSATLKSVLSGAVQRQNDTPLFTWMCNVMHKQFLIDYAQGRLRHHRETGQRQAYLTFQASHELCRQNPMCMH